MTIEEFGQSIKKKYPEYSQYSDSDIGQKMLIKYPQYKTQVTTPEPIATPTPKKTLGQKLASFGQGAEDFAVGIAKGTVSTVKNAADLGEKILFNPISKIPGLQKQYQGKATDIIPQSAYTPKNTAEKVGSGVEQTAELFTPMGLEKKGAGLLTKIAAGATEFGTKAAVQSGGDPTQTAIGAGAGATGPVISGTFNVAKNITSRLLKGLGSGLSGVSTETIDRIIANPKVAQKASEKLAASGNSKVLEENSKTILEGVSKIRKEASQEYGKSLEQLAKTDIDPGAFKAMTQNFLDNYGSLSTNGKRTLSKVEFNDPKNLAKARELIDKVSTANFNLNGKALRKLADDIENSAYKIATSDERLSFNAFVKDLSAQLENAIHMSTPKFEAMNKAYSQDRQLAESVEQIFGKVNFKNLPEVLKASQKLEGIFSQKGLAPEVVDRFLNRIGVSPEAFKTTEAVRQISNKASGANAKGLSVGEIMQQATSAIVSPKMVRDISIATGMAEQKIGPFISLLPPTIRNTVIETLLKVNQQ